jgi:hypothetical protein
MAQQVDSAAFTHRIASVADIAEEASKSAHEKRPVWVMMASPLQPIQLFLTQNQPTPACFSEEMDEAYISKISQCRKGNLVVSCYLKP